MLNKIKRKLKRILKAKTVSQYTIDPDEVFLDASNLPQFNTSQFEGQIEKPISKRMIAILGMIFAFAGAIIIVRAWVLQVNEGEAYAIQSEYNSLKQSIIFAQRGVIYDRNGIELAWNTPRDGSEFSRRQYTATSGMAHILGYVSYPKMDKSGFYYQTEYIGKDGIEREFDGVLGGKNGKKLIETNALGDIVSRNVISPPINGENLELSIDSRVQHKLYQIIADVAEEYDYVGGAGLLMDVKTGELLAAVSYPEPDLNVLAEGDDARAVNDYVTDKRNPFLNRFISGLYTPGSIIKPFFALAALNEKVIDPDKRILSTGSISIPNPYDPKRKSVFMDWKAHGLVNMRDAIAVSSNVYFYEIGGGYKDQKGLGISRIEDYARLFGFEDLTGISLPGEERGIIPTPLWKQETFPSDPLWRIGDTYNTVIGQYGFQVTPIQIVRAIAAIANNGHLLRPQIVKSNKRVERRIDGIPKGYFQVVREGMRQAVTDGTGKGLHVPYVEVAAKTGTAQVGAKKYQNAWVEGFFPYDTPRYAFAVIMERAPKGTSIGGVFVMRRLFDWMHSNTPEYFADGSQKHD